MLGALCVLLVAGGLTGTLEYDGTSFPDQQGWSRGTSLLFAHRSTNDGWFVQTAETVPYEGTLVDEDDIYRRSVAEFAGSPSFFLEWRMQTDGPRDGFANVAPAAMVLGGTSGVNYHFTIADDQVRLIRDNRLPIVFVDIAPGVPHTYRLELDDAESYRWLIDGQVVDSGIPEGTYPNPDSEIVFGARAASVDGITTVQWDYIHYGTIPEPATAILLAVGSGIIALRKRGETPRGPPW